MSSKVPVHGGDDDVLSLCVLITREDYLQYAAQLRREQRRGHLPFITGRRRRSRLPRPGRPLFRQRDFPGTVGRSGDAAGGGLPHRIRRAVRTPSR